jgi:hypothetical protein
MSAIFTLIKALPEILAIIKALQAGIDKAQADRKVKDDLQAIHAAFVAKDSAQLNHLFNS